MLVTQHFGHGLGLGFEGMVDFLSLGLESLVSFNISDWRPAVPLILYVVRVRLLFDDVVQYHAKRLAEKNVSEMISYFVSSET